MAVEIGKTGAGITSLGDVTPTVLEPISMTALDDALRAEEAIAQNALRVMQKNVERMGTIQDDLTKIQVDNPWQVAKLEEAKKNIGLNDDALAAGVENLENPVAMYELDRKMIKLSMDPSLREIKMDQANAEHYYKNIATLDDPQMKAMAMQDYAKYKQDDTGEVKGMSLNISNYKSIDVAAVYKQYLDKMAPLIKKDQTVTDANGNTYVQTIETRDPNALKLAQESFSKDPLVRNNMIAKGMMDANGNLVKDGEGRTFFDITHNAVGGGDSEMKYFKHGSNQNSSGAGTASSSTTVANETTATPSASTSRKKTSYTPMNEQEKAVYSRDEVDYRQIAKVETGSSHGAGTVHKDKNGQINVGGIALNGKTGNGFFSYLKENYPFHTKNLDFPDLTNGANLSRARKTYAEIERRLGKDTLRRAEIDYYHNLAVAPTIKHAEKALGRPLTAGEKLAVADTAVNHGQAKQVISKAASGSGSFIDNLTKERTSHYPGNKNRYKQINATAKQIDKVGGGGYSVVNTGVAVDVNAGSRNSNDISVDDVIANATTKRPSNNWATNKMNQMIPSTSKLVKTQSPMVTDPEARKWVADRVSSTMPNTSLAKNIVTYNNAPAIDLSKDPLSIIDEISKLKSGQNDGQQKSNISGITKEQVMSAPGNFASAINELIIMPVGDTVFNLTKKSLNAIVEGIGNSKKWYNGNRGINSYNAIRESIGIKGKMPERVRQFITESPTEAHQLIRSVFNEVVSSAVKDKKYDISDMDNAVLDKLLTQLIDKNKDSNPSLSYELIRERSKIRN